MSDSQRLPPEVLEARARALSQPGQAVIETFESFGQDAHLLFHCGEQRLLIKLDRIQEVLKGQAVTRVPCVGPAVAGIVNVRGTIVDVVALGRFMGLGPDPDSTVAPLRAVVLLCDVGGAVLGLLVDDVIGILSVATAAIEKPPDSLPPGWRAVVEGVVRYGEERQHVAPCVNPGSVFASPIFDGVRHGPPSSTRSDVP
ncbi:MAG: chemotaxis protein CheW [Candidatus Riflebacteria bacterium]|nr:chemotaxis protein CheW [Candidatus Riflebacteria bacterium]